MDPRVLHFTPLGLGGAMEPEDAATFQQRIMANLVLADDVAQSTRDKFEQLRTCYIQGVLCYDLFTLVADAAGLALEQALRDRFTAHHGGTVTARNEAGREYQIVYTNYLDFFEQYKKLRGSKICMGRTGTWTRFNAMLEGLLTWARHEGLLRGQRNRHNEQVKRALRNLTAHGTFHLLTPVDAARVLSDLAEIINHLWGHSTPGGRLYPAPVTRDVVAIGWNKATGAVTAGHAAQLAHERRGKDDEFTYVLARAVFSPGEHVDPNLMEYDALYATTYYPTQYLWGPGTGAQAIAWFEETAPEPDSSDHLDQIFVVRAHDGVVHLPMYPAVAAGLQPKEQQGTWYAVCADGPNEVFSHTRAFATAVNGHARTGQCRECPVDVIARGDFTTVLRAAESVGADVRTVPVPDVRTAFADLVVPRFVAVSP
ncbi:hypothetical protein [Streptomyces phaeochromogenes]|uniref:hypothetical protein n=1 Tax=Streptomyces phaeochromogenes TaxID=1923 RepID=UPI002DDBD3C1|nr:hypothetical protein [Streptomyces phaeochromogenes]WRZ34767.1 hypothetical protein OG931_47080 [Streptomyces phaeochromogenes]